MYINRKTSDELIYLKNDLFIIPISYEVNNISPESDHSIHFGASEALMYNKGSKIWCLDLPEDYIVAKEPGGTIFHYQTLAKPSGERYMPLFTSYKEMTSIYGTAIQIGVIDYETAKSFCLEEGFYGVVVAPGVLNKIIPKEEL